ncbi:VanZ family protein [Chitinophaga ginsengisegetis]|uniref:VanZ family protein n=1 Tax=Chitinophaga ginsengisegetis TaxID=393003 RepID=UPI000DB9E074|nr:VanZ family protein [Chitinophaga ginsengisegetis]MDR6570929.1 glycopeptide antibiotics resistance protein [Chitinophaga ginsengisegetis]MDR6650663.1 glycopeptide antibiotics resistance protein [Chitinophaga ginsengisegetis]MDR6657013.1 glycopeptide antibiotics resistance protein [Chitinophaga ginsengisegetis]
MNKRSIYIILLSIILLFTLYEELKLRPYLLKHHITTFYIADSLPNFLAVVVFFLGYMVIRFPFAEQKVASLIFAFVAGLTLYEVFQLWMPGRTFDVKDVIASVLGGVFCYLVSLIVNKMSRAKA